MDLVKLLSGVQGGDDAPVLLTEFRRLGLGADLHVESVSSTGSRQGVAAVRHAANFRCHCLRSFSKITSRAMIRSLRVSSFLAFVA